MKRLLENEDSITGNAGYCSPQPTNREATS
jgi:hypothetical protein